VRVSWKSIHPGRVMQQTIDLNADLAEEAGDDMAMLGLVTSANLCCGVHAGGPQVLRAALLAAKARGVVAGAHPGYADRVNFGRVIVPMPLADVTRLVAGQVGETLAIAAEVGASIAYVKPHGALYNLAAEEPEVAAAIAAGVAEVDRNLVLLGLAGSVMEAASAAKGLRFAAEAFVDRAYHSNGRLVPRGVPGAVLHDADMIAERALGMVVDGIVMAADGKHIPLRFDSLCLHGDTAGAVSIAAAVRARLQVHGITLLSFAQ
jgi:5-oxoprolinase (ATP-hydrolysing) subunit A